ncbi:putative DNA modification/repair radical SAM protein [bacterium]|nr:putative DNA modification/repair radical SAM protein [bacterium]
MELIEKLEILGAAAKFDASCSSSGSDRRGSFGGIGSAYKAGICHSWAADGRCISLLKVLFTNYCINDCAYCINRRSNDVRRAAFTVDELVMLTMNFYKRNYIEGLFLSSGIIKNADFTMEKLISVAKKLRKEENFNGYIHLKVIPGASEILVKEAGLYADRVSVNIELPSEKSLKLLTEKSRESIIKPMTSISCDIIENREERSKTKKLPVFAPAGQTTQLIVGATPDNDRKIVKLTEAFYKKFSMKRVYYSAFVPVNSDNRLPVVSLPPLDREHRLYQADWLMRFYGFKADEIVSEENPFLSEDIDPKAFWAMRNMHLFPLEINSAAFEMILRVPGIGRQSAFRIVSARKNGSLDFDDLKRIGVVLKRARYFITCRGKMMPETVVSEQTVLEAMKSTSTRAGAVDHTFEQLSLF